VPPTLVDYVDPFIRETTGAQPSSTPKTYRSALRKFFEFLGPRGLDVDAITEFAEWLTVAPATKANYLSAVAGFFRYLNAIGAIEPSAADLERLRSFLRKARKVGERLPKLPPESVITALLNQARMYAPRDFASKETARRLKLVYLRNIAMLEALRSSGMRVAELVTLRCGDLDYCEHAARVTGKGQKQRKVYFDEIAWSALWDYLRERDGTRHENALPVFAGHTRNTRGVPPITTDTVRDTLEDLARQAQIEIAITPHWFRHAFATKLLEATDDLALVQDALGHASPATTRIYAKVSSKRLREAHRQAFDKK